MTLWQNGHSGCLRRFWYRQVDADVENRNRAVYGGHDLEDPIAGEADPLARTGMVRF